MTVSGPEPTQQTLVAKLVHAAGLEPVPGRAESSNLSGGIIWGDWKVSRFDSYLDAGAWRGSIPHYKFGC